MVPRNGPSIWPETKVTAEGCGCATLNRPPPTRSVEKASAEWGRLWTKDRQKCWQLTPLRDGAGTLPALKYLNYENRLRASVAYAGSVLVARSHTRVAFLALLAMAAVWGSTFLLIKDLVTRIPPADLLAIRFAIAAVALGLIVGPRIQISRPVLTQGALLGLLYGSAQVLQTAGLAHTSASVSGFVTGLYVVATPLLTAVILRRRIANITWFAVFLACSGWACSRCAGSHLATVSC